MHQKSHDGGKWESKDAARDINSTDTANNYVTTYLTDEAINWIDNQTQPWLLFVSAYKWIVVDIYLLCFMQ